MQLRKLLRVLAAQPATNARWALASRGLSSAPTPEQRPHDDADHVPDSILPSPEHWKSNKLAPEEEVGHAAASDGSCHIPSLTSRRP